MPAVAYPTPGGLTYTQVTGLIHGVARKAKIVGFDLIEFVPKRDANGLAAFTAGRILWNVIGSLANAPIRQRRSTPPPSPPAARPCRAISARQVRLRAPSPP